jgi:glycosyltransferase involved in cell wall biosynthesis
MFWTSMFASPVARVCGVPVILETTHVREQWRKGWKANYRIDRGISRFVDRYIAVSHANARYLAEEKKIPQTKITVIQNGCDLSRFNREHRAPQGMKVSLGFAGDNPVLLLIGRLEPQKGHTVMLQAMPAILREFPNARLLCLGDGALRSELERQIASLGISQSVRMLGYQPNVPDWLALADVVVLPSFFEGLPLVAIEALAAEKPVVATAVDGTPEVIMDGRTGLLVGPGDAASLADAICRMLRDAGLRQTLASAGHDFVRRRFTRERQVSETEQCYLNEWRRVTGQCVIAATSNAESMETVSVG